jgi:hypothetical protein
MAFVIEDDSGSFGGSEDSFNDTLSLPPRQAASAPKPAAGAYDFDIEDEETSAEFSPPQRQTRQKTPVQVRKSTSVATVVPTIGKAAAVDAKERAAAMLANAALNSQAAIARA